MKEENETTIGELVKRRRKLEDDISALMKEFEDCCGVEVRKVDFFRADDSTGKRHYMVSVKTEL